jgi:p25-alpha
VLLSFVLAAAGAATIPDAVAFHDDKNLYTGVHGKGGPTINDNTISLSNLADRSGADVRGIKAGNKETSIADTLAELTVANGSPRRVSAATTAATTPSPRKSSGAVSPGRAATAAAAAAAALTAAPVHSGDIEGRVQAVFLAFCSSVAKQGYEADSAKFFKLCSDCGLVDARLSRTQCDLIFTRAAVQKRMSYEAFRHQAVAMIAEQKSISEGTILQAIAGIQGISSSGTVAEPSRFHDDKSEFAISIKVYLSSKSVYISLSNRWAYALMIQ